jgi:hypothetical protein
MATVVLFHSVLGIRQGELDAAEQLRGDGHEVLVPDLYAGRVFDGYEPAIAWSDELGNDALFERGLAAVADVPDGFVAGGFSQGSTVAVFVAIRRAVAGVLQFSGLNVVEWFGPTPHGLAASTPRATKRCATRSAMTSSPSRLTATSPPLAVGSSCSTTRATATYLPTRPGPTSTTLRRLNCSGPACCPSSAYASRR